MLALEIFIYFLLGALIVYEIFLVQQIYCSYFHKQVPLVPSSRNNRKFIIREIKENYKNAKYICEIGSGLGGLSRKIARNTNAKVIGIENMYLNVVVSKIFDFLSMTTSETVLCDAFEFLDKTKIHFDVAVAFMGPIETNFIAKYKNKIDVLISIDFELKNLKPNKVINTGAGYTLFNGKKYPHRLYIYNFKK